MVPRIKTLRKISRQPAVKGFRPFGEAVSDAVTPPVTLLIEEYEAIRLSDFDHCNHQEAAEMMGVSRPTFTRIYAKALEKVARAFVGGRTIIIQGGHVYFDSSWYICTDCNSYFTNPAEGSIPSECPLCSKSNIEQTTMYLDSKECLSMKSDNCVAEKNSKKMNRVVKG